MIMHKDVFRKIAKELDMKEVDVKAVADKVVNNMVDYLSKDENCIEVSQSWIFVINKVPVRATRTVTFKPARVKKGKVQK